MTHSVIQMEGKKLLIHIGYHKTGTTLLQRNIFTDSGSGFFSPADRFELRRKFIETPAFGFSTRDSIEFVRQSITTAKTGSSLIPVISHEQFSGQPAAGGYGLRKRERGVSSAELARRLHSCFPDANVLIVIREQKSMIRSIYKFLVCGWEGRLSASMDEFLDQSPLKNGYSPLFDFRYLEYHHLISHYQGLFGKDSICVLPFEMLKENQLEFINRIQLFAGAEPTNYFKLNPVNKGYSASVCGFKRNLNRILVSPNRPGLISRAEKMAAAFTKKLNRRIPDYIHQKSENKMYRTIERIVAGKFAESNSITAGLTGLDLQAYGYEVFDEDDEQIITS